MSILTVSCQRTGLSATRAVARPCSNSVRQSSRNPIQYTKDKFSEAFLEYPKGYNAEVHGPFYRFRYYGTPCKRVWQVPLKDMPAWLLARNYSPIQVLHCARRNWYQFRQLVNHERNVGGRIIFLWCAILMAANMYAGQYYGVSHGTFNKYSR